MLLINALSWKKSICYSALLWKMKFHLDHKVQVQVIWLTLLLTNSSRDPFWYIISPGMGLSVLEINGEVARLLYKFFDGDYYYSDEMEYSYWNKARTPFVINCCTGLLLLPWWQYQIETFTMLLALCAGDSPVNSQHKGQCLELWCFLWSAPWVNNRQAGDFGCHCAHYDVIVMPI